jgi:hypothetical protein
MLTSSAPRDRATDADPNNYEVLTSTLPLATLGAGEAAKVLGFVRPFGSAPLTSGLHCHRPPHLPAVLGIGWGEKMAPPRRSCRAATRAPC